MKKTIWILIGLVSLFPQNILGQSVVITSKLITYTRPKPSSDSKITFTVNYPRIKGKSTKLTRKIEDSISYRKVLSFKAEDEMGEYQWLEEADFQVVYNEKWILSIYLSMNGIGAHPTSFGKNAVVDLRTGNRVRVNDVFTKPDELTAQIRKIQQDEITDSTKEIKEQKDYGEVDTQKLFQHTEFKKIHLADFSVQKDGIIFHYDHGFPYYLRAFEPGGNYFLSWKELKPFIKKDGLFGKFVK